MSALDARPVATEAKAAIKAQLGPNNVYDFGQVPGADGVGGTLPNIFVLLSVERRYNDTRILSGDDGLTGWRIAARSVGRTVDECRWAMLKVATALDGKRLTLDGAVTPPIQFEADQSPEWDDSRYSALTLYTF